MTDSLSQNQSLDDRPHPPFWVKLLQRTVIGFALILIVSTVAGGTWLWFFVNNDLGRLVEKELTKFIDRRVKIGSIEKFYLTGLRVGLSTLPATTSDPNFAEIPSIRIGFNPVMLLLQRTLNLNIVLIEPTIYLEQDMTGNWLELTLNQIQNSSKTMNINIKTVKVDDGQIILLPNGQKRAALFQLEEPMVLAPLVLHDVNLKAKFLNNQTETKYQGTAKPRNGGYFKIQGQTNLSTLETELYLKGDDLAAADVMPFTPNLPLNLNSGELNGQLKVTLQDSNVLSWQGKAKFKHVNGLFGRLTQPISDASGQIHFKNLQLSLENIKAVYAELPFKLNGTIDTTSDYNLTASIPPLTLDRYLNSLDLTLSVPLTGEARSELQVTGPLHRPIVSGTIVSTQPIAVDLIDVMAARIRLKLEDKTLELTNFEVEPTLGGLIYGRGRVQLTEIPELEFHILGENLPGDAIAQLYTQETLPIAIGRIHTITQVLGQLDKPTTLVKWRSPDIIYPGSGEITLTNDTILLKNTVFQVAGGTVELTGSTIAQKNRWQAFMNAKNIQLNQLTSSDSNELENNELENSATLAAGLRLSGELTTLNPTDIQGNGELELIARDAKVTGRGTLAGGQWRVSLGIETLPEKALRLHELDPDLPLPIELSSGTLELSGTVEDFYKKIDLTKFFQMNVPEQEIDDRSAN